MGFIFKIITYALFEIYKKILSKLTMFLSIIAREPFIKLILKIDWWNKMIVKKDSTNNYFILLQEMIL